MGIVIDNQYADENTLNNRLLFSQGIEFRFRNFMTNSCDARIHENHLNEWGLFIHFSNPFE